MDGYKKVKKEFRLELILVDYFCEIHFVNFRGTASFMGEGAYSSAG